MAGSIGISVSIVPPDRPRPRRWRARLRAMGWSNSDLRIIAKLARRDFIVAGKRIRHIDDLLAGRAPWWTKGDE
jgi:hypothetical protein